MYTIGYVSSQNTKMNTSMQFLLDVGWQIIPIEIENLLKLEFDAIVLEEETTVQTCNWMITLAKSTPSPIYVLANDDEVCANIIYLKMGAKACFSVKMLPEEFYYTLKNLLSEKYLSHSIREGNQEKKVSQLKLIFGNLSVLINGEKEVVLTKKEFQVLEMLSEQPETAISYEKLQDKLWPESVGDDNDHCRLANVICNLRKKIEQDKKHPRFVKTIRSRGYMLRL